MKKHFGFTFLFLSFALLGVQSMFASEARPLWMRYPAISPDGKFIAFTYQGNLYKVPATGGQAQQLTTLPAYDTHPVWSPDASTIAFVSDREHGAQDIYVMPANGGAARRLTTHSANEVLHGFSPDGKHILFSAHYQDPVSSVLFPTARLTELYQVPVLGGAAQPVLAIPVGKAVYTPDAQSLVYQDLKGFENTWRKHHTSSVTRDIIRYDFATQQYTPLVTWHGEDLEPTLSADGNTLYYLSERSGSLNVYQQLVATPGAEPQQLTHFSGHPVRFLSVSQAGTLCFGYDGEIYTLTPGGQPQRVAITITTDAYPNNLTPLTFTSGLRAAAVAPDGSELAFQVRGEIFVTAADYSTTRRITHTPAAESSVCFAEKGRALIYDSEREGHSNLYIARLKRAEDAGFAYATLVEEQPLIPNNTSEKMLPVASPDGTKVAYIQDRRYLMVYDLNSHKAIQVMDNPLVPDGDMRYVWSPDNRYLAIEYVANHHAPFSDIGLVDITQPQPQVRNITQTGYFDTNPRFVLGGNAILFSSDRYGMKNLGSWGSQQDFMLVFLNREAYDKYKMTEEEYKLWKEAQKKTEKDEKKPNDKKNSQAPNNETVKPIQVEWDNMERRVVRLTTASGNMGDAYIDPDGNKLYYTSAYESGYDLWSLDLRKHTPTLLKKLGKSGYAFMPDASGKKLFLVSSKDIQKFTLPDEKLAPVTYRAEMRLDQAKERNYMYQVVKREEAARFYDPLMHGVDWKGLTAHYEKFLPHINNNYDFSEMLSELLGELNVSHTGSGYRAARNAPATAELGLFVHRTTQYAMVVDEVVVGGPFDTHTSQVKKGDVIEMIDGVTLAPDTDYYPLLADKAGKPLLVGIYSPTTGKRWQEVIKPLRSAQWQELLYQRWVTQREQEVQRLSGGKLGYAHVGSMDDASFRTLYSSALGKYYQCQGLVVDIRYNGGGRLHEDLEVFLSGTKYLTQEMRGAYYCDMPSRRWTKPSVMLMCEADYSNAHGSPWVYKKMKLGKLVGMPVPGTMTSVNWVTLQDPSLFFGIPVVGYKTAEGYYLENHQIEPDIKAPLDLNQALKGHDTQLEAAVRALLP